MTPFLLGLEDRIRVWRDLRMDLAKCDDLIALESVASWWAQAPLITYSIDVDKPSDWPTPWDLLLENQYCRTAVAYMMAATLRLTDKDRWTDDRIRLVYIKDQEASDEMMAVLIDNEYLLNYSVGEVFDYNLIKDRSTILFEYRISDTRVA